MPNFTLNPSQLVRVNATYKYPTGDLFVYTGYYNPYNSEATAVGTSQQFLTLFSDKFGDVMGDCMSSSMESVSFHLVQIQGSTGELGKYDDLLRAMIGGVDEPALPPSDACVIRRLSAFSGRTKRGRFYLGGLPKLWADNGRFTGNEFEAGMATATSFARQGFIPLAGNLAWEPVLPGYRPNNQPPQNRYEYTPITGASWDPIIRTQRRRQVGRGM